MRRRADPNYFLPLTVCYFIIADATDHVGHQSLISTFFLDCKLHTENRCYQHKPAFWFKHYRFYSVDPSRGMPGNINVILYNTE